MASRNSTSAASALLLTVFGIVAAGAIAGCGGGGGGGGGGGAHSGGNGAYTVAEITPLPNDVSMAPAAINTSGNIAASSASGQSLPSSDSEKPSLLGDAGSSSDSEKPSLLGGVGSSSARKSHVTNTYVDQAALVVSGTPAALGFPAGTDGSIAVGINASNAVVGYSVVPTGTNSVALLWQSSAMTTLVGLGGSSKALDINDGGTIVGQSNGLPVYWTTGNPATALSVPNGDTGIAAAINASGEIVGSVTSNTTTQGAEWSSTSSSPTLLPLPSGATGSEAIAINSGGEIVGEANVNGLNVPVAWQNGQVTLLPAPSSGAAQGINDSGVIVGAITVAGGLHAVIWNEGSVVDLNTKLPNGSGWTLSQANAIDTAGEIVGIGNKGGFTLTPGGSGSGTGTTPPPP